MPRIMISYRRADSAGSTGRIFDHLSAHFGAGNVFVDIDGIPVGVDFRTLIDDALKSMDVLLVIVGSDWLCAGEHGTPRICEAEDMVRVEIETAFRNGIRVVPVLVDGASMPARNALPESLTPLASINAAVVSPGIDFRNHIERLIRVLEPTVRLPETTTVAVERTIGNLPVLRRALIGRASDVVAIARLLANDGLVTVTGPGGIGKTRVALQVASDTRAAYADGAWVVDLASLQSTGLVAHEIASLLGVRDDGTRSISQALVAHLKERDLLLVFDNCEHLVAEIASIARLLLESCARVRLLATSREPLRVDGERPYRLPSMSMPPAFEILTASAALAFDSVALFVERAVSSNPDFRLTDEIASLVCDICRRLDGIPLAIELAAARVNVLGVAKLHQRLDERFRILSDGGREIVARHKTMRATIDWSYELLTVTEQKLFRRLGVFAGGWTLEAAESTCAFDGVAAGDVLDGLSSLARKSLVSVNLASGEARYRLLESMRAYALEKSEFEAATCFAQHAEWVTAFVEDAAARFWTSPAKEWLEKLRVECDNIRQVLQRAIDVDECRLAGARIAGRLGTFWYDTGLKTEGKRWTEALLSRVDETSEPLVAARLSNVLALLASGKRAVAAGRQAVEVFERFGEPREIAESSAVLAFALWQIGDLAGSAHYSETATRLYTAASLRNTRFCATALDTYANVLRAVGKPDAARTLLDEAISIFSGIGDELGAATARGDLAELEFAAGNTNRAIELVDEAAIAFRKYGAVSREATAVVNSATYRLELGQIDRAREAARAALTLALQTGDKPIAVVALQNLAATEALGGDPPRAARILGYVDEWYRAEGYERDWSERRTLEILLRTLSEHLPQDSLREFRASGSTFSEDRVLRELAR